MTLGKGQTTGLSRDWAPARGGITGRGWLEAIPRFCEFRRWFALLYVQLMQKADFFLRMPLAGPCRVCLSSWHLGKGKSNFCSSSFIHLISFLLQPQHALPDVFLWLISGNKRLAYQGTSNRRFNWTPTLIGISLSSSDNIILRQKFLEMWHVRGSHCICRSTAANSREEAALLDGRGGEGRGVRVGPEGLPQGEQRRKDFFIWHRFAIGEQEEWNVCLALNGTNRAITPWPINASTQQSKEFVWEEKAGWVNECGFLSCTICTHLTW